MQHGNVQGIDSRVKMFVILNNSRKYQTDSSLFSRVDEHERITKIFVHR